MSSEYDSITAFHYAAYRPTLHNAILNRCISRENISSLGLDIGCGIGHSSIALTKFCEKVVGVDPSKSMIKNAIEHQKVEYQNSDCQVLDFDSDSFDLVTFAGSLYYAKSQRLLDEVVRVAKNKGLVIIYDFEILVGDVLKGLGFSSKKDDTYNHETDFSGLSAHSISLISNEKETAKINVSVTNLAHLILSVKEHYLFFNEKLVADNLHHQLSERLFELIESTDFEIDAKLYYKVYLISKSDLDIN